MKINRKALLIAALSASVVFIGLLVIREPLQHFVFSFLSLNRPIKAQVLVIEGWLTDRMLKEAAGEFKRGKYSYCLVSGRSFSSHMPMRVIIRSGIDSVAVKFTDAETRRGHNTYHIALASRQWLRMHDPAVSTLNVFTAGPHGRKSWIIFKRVFGHDYSIGVISSSIERNDTDLWWESEQGLCNVVKYGIGCIYAQFWPFEK